MSSTKRQIDRKVDELIALNHEFHRERWTRVGADSVERQGKILKRIAAKNPMPTKGRK